MAQYLINTEIYIGYVFTVDNDEAEAGGVTVTITRPDGTTIVTNGAATVVAGTVGTYQYYLSAAQIGTHAGTWTAIWTITYLSSTLTQVTSFVVGARAAFFSGADIRRRVGRRMRDYWQAFATAGGTQYQVIDRTRLYHGAGFFSKAHVKGISGNAANLLQERDAGAFSGGTITLTSSFSGATVQEEEFDIHKRWTFQEYRDAINDAINELYPKIYLPVVDETTIATSGTLRYNIESLAVPLSELGTVEIETSARRPWQQRSAIVSADKRYLEFDLPAPSAGRKIRIIYEGRIQPLVNEFDIIEADPVTIEAILSYLWVAVPSKLIGYELAEAPVTELPRLERMVDRYAKMGEDVLKSSRQRRLRSMIVDGTFGGGFSAGVGGGDNGWRLGLSEVL